MEIQVVYTSVAVFEAYSTWSQQSSPFNVLGINVLYSSWNQAIKVEFRLSHFVHACQYIHLCVLHDVTKSQDLNLPTPESPSRVQLHKSMYANYESTCTTHKPALRTLNSRECKTAVAGN